MKTCACGGHLLRHGVTRYASDANLIGIRYRCRACGKTFTQRMPEDRHDGALFQATGRPVLVDWRVSP